MEPTPVLDALLAPMEVPLMEVALLLLTAAVLRAPIVVQRHASFALLDLGHLLGQSLLLLACVWITTGEPELHALPVLMAPVPKVPTQHLILASAMPTSTKMRTTYARDALVPALLRVVLPLPVFALLIHTGIMALALTAPPILPQLLDPLPSLIASATLTFMETVEPVQDALVALMAARLLLRQQRIPLPLLNAHALPARMEPILPHVVDALSAHRILPQLVEFLALLKMFAIAMQTTMEMPKTPPVALCVRT